ncbi:DUF3015 domain-containing protein [Silvanigrella paludirubra]|uniref:DUF3015 domain-containing protein n=1 Tax=Silvanigrella paludirubra TaxID=2499159 RepID=A0A6N6VWU5_9BACT|nr:DUF3015 family protein [Silvanigrella paludirubra]KAB8040469.1 DUF3015 domain-containing protein [Silvanigrella paludirubra]
MKNFMKNILFVLIVGAFCLLASRAHAVGSAGCGLGSVVFKGNEWWKQILAMTTNHLTSSQFIGITTGTSNCAPGLFGIVQKQEDYVVANFSTLQREAAQGSGESLNGLASTLGCENSSFPSFGAYTQEKYYEIFSAQDAKEVLQNIKVEVEKNQNLSRECKFIQI